MNPVDMIRIGRAGTGKTHDLVRAAAESESPVCLAFTHRAVNVMRRKLREAGISGVEVRTLHSLVYAPSSGSGREAAVARWAALTPERRKEILDRDDVRSEQDALDVVRDEELTFVATGKEHEYASIFVDEASMLTETQLSDLIAVAGPATVNVYGDPAQLPPVGEQESALDVLARTYPWSVVEGEKQHRQEGDLLDVANVVRDGGKPFDADGRCWTGWEFDARLLRRADMVLCFQNATRKIVHRCIRAVERRPALPSKGEALTFHDPGGYYRNAEWAIKGTDMTLLEDALPAQCENVPVLLLEGELDDGRVVKVVAHPLGFDAEGPSTKRQVRANAPNMRTEFGGDAVLTVPGSDEPVYAFPTFQDKRGWVPLPRPAWLDYACARTIHKAQGDEAEKVIVVDDFGWLRRRDPDMHRKMMYTAVTRAKERLVIMRPPGRGLRDLDSMATLRATQAALSEQARLSGRAQSASASTAA